MNEKWEKERKEAVVYTVDRLECAKKSYTMRMEQIDTVANAVDKLQSIGIEPLYVLFGFGSITIRKTDLAKIRKLLGWHFKMAYRSAKDATTITVTLTIAEIENVTLRYDTIYISGPKSKCKIQHVVEEQKSERYALVCDGRR